MDSLAVEQSLHWFNSLSAGNLELILRIALLLLIGLPGSYLLTRVIKRITQRSLSPQHQMILLKAILYTCITVILLTALNEMGFQLSTLLGAAGIIGIALGFASQTSVSNIISGLFLIAEKSFVVGDIIQVGSTTGSVLSVDILSVKLKTFDNRFIRIPNETLIKSEVVNFTRFPIRRVDIEVGVAYREDLEHVTQVLLSVAEENLNCLKEPSPLVFIKGYGASSIDFQCSVWTPRENWLQTRTSMFKAIKRRFDQEGIEIPFPHLSLYAGSVSEAHKLRVVNGQDEGQSATETQAPF